MEIVMSRLTSETGNFLRVLMAVAVLTLVSTAAPSLAYADHQSTDDEEGDWQDTSADPELDDLQYEPPDQSDPPKSEDA